MKHLLLILISLAALLVSCTKQEAGTASAQEPAVETVDIEFSLDGGEIMSFQTKSTTQATETKINNFQVLVFLPNGTLDAYGKSTDGNAISIKITKGTGRTCYAVVNSSRDLSTVASVSALTALTSELSDNSLTNLEMIGKVDSKDFTSATTCSIPVKRFAAKVIIDKITPNFSSAAHAAMTFKVKGIYLINANGYSPYTQVVDGCRWYNQFEYDSDVCDALLADKPMDVTVTKTSPMSTPHYFYCYANPTKTDTSGGTIFTPRYTRLVIETALGGSTYYYPINIIGTDGVLNANTSYEITNLTITGLGSSDPDVVPQKGSVSFSVTVTDWTTGFNKTVEY